MTEAPVKKLRGPRGEVGKGTPGSRLKSLHRAARKEGVVNSLRSFARALVGSPLPGNADAKAWLASKAVQP